MDRNISLFGKNNNQFEYAMSLISQCTEDYIFYYNITRDYYYVTESALKKFNFPDTAFYNASEYIFKITYENDKQLLIDDITQLRNRQKNEHDLEYRWYDRNGDIVWISCRGIIADFDDDDDIILIGRISEIGTDKKADNITGLKMENRIPYHFEKYMLDGMHHNASMLMIGIDNFKSINDMYGKDVGDHIMKDLAKCIEKLKDDSSFLYRIKGDGFLIVDYNNGSSAKCRQLYIDIRNDLSNISIETNYKAIFTISGGITDFDETESVKDVLRRVEFSLAQAKRNGKNCTYIYDQETYDAYIRKLDIQEKLRQSVDNNFEGFELYYQPVVDPFKNKLIGAEALLRWKCDEYQNVYPSEFIPILEETYLIIMVGKWVFNTAIRQCKEWQNILPDFKISINLSYIQIKKCNVIDDVLDCINETGINPATVVFEFTESHYIESDTRVKKLIDAFTKHGIQLAIDDFGTGYSNLTLLQNLKVNTLKLDRTFVSKALQTDFDFRLITHVVQMAHNIDLSVCLEGVETEDEKQRLSILHPDFIQGYLYGRPVDKNTFYKQFLEKLQ